jgi:hypothetical protein
MSQQSMMQRSHILAFGPAMSFSTASSGWPQNEQVDAFLLTQQYNWWRVYFVI